MRHIRQFAVACLSLCPLLVSSGCSDKRAAPSPRTHASIDPNEVRGTIRLREGTRLPAGAELIVTVKWYDDTIAQRLIEHGDAWPVTFRFPVKWPEGKGIPTHSVEVFASAEYAGRTIGVTETKHYVYPLYRGDGFDDHDAGGKENKPLELMLHPSME